MPELVTVVTEGSDLCICFQVDSIGDDPGENERLKNALIDAVGEGTSSLVLDFGRIDRVSSRGVNLLAVIIRNIIMGSGTVKIINVLPHVYNTLHIMGVTDDVQIEQVSSDRGEL